MQAEYLSYDNLAEITGMSRQFWVLKVLGGELPSVKLGRSVRISRASLEEYLADKQRGTEYATDAPKRRQSRGG
jgi:excisionase family DNA binding protein